MRICQKGFSTAVVLLLVIVVLGIGAGAYYYGKSTGQQVPLSPPPPSPSSSPVNTPSATPTPTSTTTPASSPTSVPVSANSNLFTSPGLGISFNYTSKKQDNGSMIEVKQIGDKVYVYSTPIKPPIKLEDGQFVEVFLKDKNDSLSDAIKKKILVGYSSSDCLVKTVQNFVGSQSYPAGYEIAEITVPGPNDNLEAMFAKASKCPEKYVTSNGISYFLTNINHPDKFVYLSIGQYGIDSGISDKLWQTTIKFLP